MTAPEKGRWYWVRNWLHYHWVYLVIAAVVLWVGISWLANALHWGETLPDYQIAYVGKSALPEDTAHAIEAAFAQYGEDLNGDGIVSVKLNQYVSDTEDVENASTYALAAQMQFLSDMNAGTTKPSGYRKPCTCPMLKQWRSLTLKEVTV